MIRSHAECHKKMNKERINTKITVKCKEIHRRRKREGGQGGARPGTDLLKTLWAHDVEMTSMRRRYVASTSLRRHVPARNLAPLGPPISKPWPPNILDLPTPMKYIRWKKKIGGGRGFRYARHTRREFNKLSRAINSCRSHIPAKYLVEPRLHMKNHADISANETQL